MIAVLRLVLLDVAVLCGIASIVALGLVWRRAWLHRHDTSDLLDRRVSR